MYQCPIRFVVLWVDSSPGTQTNFYFVRKKLSLFFACFVLVYFLTLVADLVLWVLPGEPERYRGRFHGSFCTLIWAFFLSLAAGTVGGSAGVCFCTVERFHGSLLCVF